MVGNLFTFFLTVAKLFQKERKKMFKKKQYLSHCKLRWAFLPFGPGVKKPAQHSTSVKARVQQQRPNAAKNK